MSWFDSPQLVMERLEEIEEQLAENQNALESAAGTYFSLKRDFDLEYAKALVQQAGGNDGSRKAAALIVVTEMDFYEEFVQAEAAYESLKLAQKSLDGRASIGQSILKAQNAAGAGRPQRGGM